MNNQDGRSFLLVKSPLSGERAFRRETLEKIKLFPTIGVEAAMNVDLVFLKPRPVIKEVFIGEFVAVFKGVGEKCEVGRAVLEKAREHNRLERIKESNFIALVELLEKLIKE
ncbi:hypothetical protein HY991_03120 [Candidatus Micrarchaeota archaeon]|nr:hypothetical protein [Candidatus Micrarchaeota archaeon]